MPTRGRREGRSIILSRTMQKRSTYHRLWAMPWQLSAGVPARALCSAALRGTARAETEKERHDERPPAVSEPAGFHAAAGAECAADHARPVHQGPSLREPARAAEPDRAD